MQRLGIDIGSKTLKLVLLDEQGDVVFSSYQKHRSKIDECLREAIHAIVWRIGDRTVRITVTGSSGMRISEVFGIPFVQEVVALKRAVLKDYPDADAVLEMGGEDTKLIYLTGAPEQRMNNICAGGTGSFIEMMGGLMGARTSAIGRLAMGYSTIYPIASRCAVFAKSDVRPLLNAGARREDVAASVLDAVCTQAVAGLSAGRPITGTVLLLGGPFQHISALRDAFCRVTGFDRAHAVVPKEAHMFVAHGAAISKRASEPIELSRFEKMIAETDIENDAGIARLRPLFESEEELAEFRKRHSRQRLPRSMLIDAGLDLFLGVDAGSTTAKIAIIDADGGLVAYDYHRHRGDVVGTLTRMLKQLFVQLYAPYSEEHIIRRACVVGYGEELCKAAFGIDMGEVETVAHLRAAVAIDPEVDFLLDIGGQDIKCFYVQDGVIQDVVLNEACSSGCGSLFDSSVRSMGRGRSDAVGEALRAKSPVDLGTRCTTFMNSRIRHAQKEGVPTEDIIAGICYATVRNALFKVVRQPDFTKVGKHIVVQGGAFANDALLRAFELETGVEVSRPDLSQIMGAWGAALVARDSWLAQKRDDPEAAMAARSGLIGAEMLESMDTKKTVKRCDICANRCELRITRFAEREMDVAKRVRGSHIVEGTERVLVTGNRCERGALAHGGTAAKKKSPPNLVKMKRALIRSYDKGTPQRIDPGSAGSPVGGEPVFGIPKALALYGTYPFWKTLLDCLGVRTVAGAEPSADVFRMGMSSIPSEGMCYPAKLVFGHAADLAARGADVLFMPVIETAFGRYGLAGEPVPADFATCPLVENMADMIACNTDGSLYEQVHIAAPDLRGAAALEDAVGPLVSAFADAGIERTREQVHCALKAAQEEYRSCRLRLAKAAEKTLSGIEAGKYKGIVLIGHSYHVAQGISHGIDELLGELGYAVLERTDYAGDPANADGAEGLWFENEDALKRIGQCEGRNGLQAIIVRSFGCGIDALIADKVRERLRRNGSIYTELKMDQIVDLATIRIRLRSLAYAHRQREGASEIFPLTVPPEAYKPKVEPLAGKDPRKPVLGGKDEQAHASSKKERAAASTLVDPSPPPRRRRFGLPDLQENAGIAGIAIDRPTSLDVNMSGPAGTPVNLSVAQVEGAPPPGVAAKGAGPSVREIEEALFSHSYQGLASVDGVPKPTKLEPPGTELGS